MSEEVSCVYLSPLGPLKLVANTRGICAVKFLFGEHGSRAQGNTESEGEHDQPLLELTKRNPEARQHLKTCISWLDAYFNCTLNKDVVKPTLVIPHESNKFPHGCTYVFSQSCITFTHLFRRLL